MSVTVNTTAVPPMPAARRAMAERAKPGLLRSARAAYARSLAMSLIMATILQPIR